jgi:hypothetical protein
MVDIRQTERKSNESLSRYCKRSSHTIHHDVTFERKLLLVVDFRKEQLYLALQVKLISTKSAFCYYENASYAFVV